MVPPRVKSPTCLPLKQQMAISEYGAYQRQLSLERLQTSSEFSVGSKIEVLGLAGLRGRRTVGSFSTQMGKTIPLSDMPISADN